MEAQRHIRARPGWSSQMSRHLLRIRNDYRFAKSESLHDPQQPFDKGNAEKRAERIGSVGENE